MKPTIAYLQQKFREFNRQIFAGRLPEPPFELTNAETFVGQCKSRITRRKDGREEHSDFRLRFSQRFDLDQPTLDDVIIHEMIHYFILINGLPDRTTHGPIFRAMMTEINREHGRAITVVCDPKASQRPAFAPGERQQYVVIAEMTTAQGERAIKVLPRVAKTIMAYWKAVTSSPQIKDVKVWLHCHPFFNRYPKSGALKFHTVDPAELDDALKGARLIEISATSLKTSDTFHP